MYFYTVDQGEGIAGDYATVGATTTTIYSCMGIIFLNDATKRGGLFHYPAEALDSPFVRPTLMCMYNQIRPKRIVLAPSPREYGVGSSTQDVAEVKQFLKSLATLDNAIVEQPDMSGKASASYWWDGKKVRVNEYCDVTQTRDGLGALENAYNPQARTLANTVQYYGYNGEKNRNGPLLKQGATW